MGWHPVAPWPPAADAIAAPSPCPSQVSRSPLGVNHLPRGVFPRRTGAARLGACVCLPRFPQTVGATGYSTPRLLSAAPPPARLLWSWYAGGAPLAVAGGPVALPSPPFFSGSAGLMPGAIGDLTRSASGYPRHPGSYKIRSGAQGMGPELPAGGCYQAPWGLGVTRQQPRRVLAFFAIDPTCATPQRAQKE